MAKRKISLIGLVVVMICVLVFAPVVTAGIYFIHTVSGQLQHTASETVSMYLNEFTDRTDRMMETLRDGVYYLTSDSAAQQMMSSSKPLTQIQILQLEQNFSRAFSLGDSLNPDVVSAIYLIKNDQYVPVYGGNYYLNTSWRVRQMYQTHEDCNSARTLYTHYAIIGYAYMIVDFVDLNTMQPLGKIIVELNIDKLLLHAVAEPALPFHCRHFQRCSGQTHRLSADRPVPRERGYEQVVSCVQLTPKKP